MKFGTENQFDYPSYNSCKGHSFCGNPFLTAVACLARDFFIAAVQYICLQSCICIVCYRLTVVKDTPNKGRLFYVCSKDRGKECRFFQWADDMPSDGNRNGGRGAEGSWDSGK